jgi:hypothetical protein
MDQADKTESDIIPQEFLATEARRLREIQKSMRDCLTTITRLQTECNLSKEDIQWITGLETFKGVDLPTLEKATNDILEHCESLQVQKETVSSPA